jgi:SHS family lactate transporter-like MFS transporter
MADEKFEDNVPPQRTRAVISGDDPDEHFTIAKYLRTRLTRLVPPMNPAPNPFKALALLNLQQWLFFLVAFLGWTLDAIDFFTVSLTVTDLAKTFGKKNSDITWGITLVLMLRSVGSIIFGIASDRYGRKWPFIINNILFIVLELGTGFTQTYKQFLGVRALFGIAMGMLKSKISFQGSVLIRWRRSLRQCCCYSSRGLP